MKPSVQTKLFLDRFPAIYLSLLRLRRMNHWSRKWVVNPDTDIVIEGFPRSGNSFAYSAFKRSNPSRKKIATHVHMPAQIVMAARFRFPCLVLLREPTQAICSLMAFSVQIGDRAEESFEKTIEGMKGAFQYYTCFYQRVYAVREAVVWAPFEKVISDFGALIDVVNRRYDCGFSLFDQSEENVAKIFEEAPVHLGPREDRDAIKTKLRSIAEADELDGFREAAVQMHRMCLESA